MPWSKEEIYQITAEELKDGLYINLGIGMPTHVAKLYTSRSECNISKRERYAWYGTISLRRRGRS